MEKLNVSDLTMEEMAEAAGGAYWQTQCFLAGAAGVLGVCAMNVEVVAFCAFYIRAYCID